MATKNHDKYLVVKRDDLYDFFRDYHPPCNCRTWGECSHWGTLNKEGARLFKALNTILAGIAKNRKNANKKENKYIVINQDEPYADMIWEAVLGMEEHKSDMEELKSYAAMYKALFQTPQVMKIMDCACDKVIRQGDTIVRVFGKDHDPECPIAKYYIKTQEIIKIYETKIGPVPKYKKWRCKGTIGCAAHCQVEREDQDKPTLCMSEHTGAEWEIVL